MVKLHVYGGFAPVECTTQMYPHNEHLTVFTSPERVVAVSSIPVDDIADAMLVPAGCTVNGTLVVPRVSNGVWVSGIIVNKDAVVRPPASSPMQKWVSIKSFSGVVSSVKKLFGGIPVMVTYRGKIKIHGTNAGIQITAGGKVVAQSRNRVISPVDDNLEFAKWVASTSERWARLMPCVVYGEWCGPGVQKGVAISGVAERQFCVFAITIPATLYDGGFDANGITNFIYEPDEIERWLGSLVDLDRVHVLPWHHAPLETILPDNALTASKQFNDMTTDVAERDPWVHKVFGVAGPGEGLVEFPVVINGIPMTRLHEFSLLSFKSKGDNHVVKKRRDGAGDAAAQVEVPHTVVHFVYMMITGPRCEQGLNEVGGRRLPELFRTFLAWMLKDIEKEGQEELAAGGLVMGDVRPALSRACKRWWFQMDLPPTPPRK